MEWPYLILFVCAWLFISWFIAHAGGWSTLANKYKATCEPPQHLHNFCSATLNWSANYQGVLRIGFLPEGLYLVPFFLFRFAHPPLLIPWSDITEANDSSRWFKRFSIGNPAIAVMMVTPGMRKKIKAELESTKGQNQHSM